MPGRPRGFIGQFLASLTPRQLLVVIAEEYLGALFGRWPGPEGFFFRYLTARLLFKRVASFCWIYPGARLTHVYGLSVGRNFNINTGAHIDARGGVTIGDHVAIGPNAVIVSSNHTWKDPQRPFLLQGHTPGPVHIGDQVWIGANATVLAGVTIADRTIVAAGAVVTSDTQPDTIVAGVPARPIGPREKKPDAAA